MGSKEPERDLELECIERKFFEEYGYMGAMEVKRVEAPTEGISVHFVEYDIIIAMDCYILNKNETINRRPSLYRFLTDIVERHPDFKNIVKLKEIARWLKNAD